MLSIVANSCVESLEAFLRVLEVEPFISLCTSKGLLTVACAIAAAVAYCVHDDYCCVLIRKSEYRIVVKHSKCFQEDMRGAREGNHIFLLFCPYCTYFSIPTWRSCLHRSSGLNALACKVDIICVRFQICTGVKSVQGCYVENPA